MVKARINGIDCLLFYDERISTEHAPQGYPHVFQIRHDEDDWTVPITLERQVVVNFFGTVFMRDPVQIDADGYVEIEEFEVERKPTVLRMSGAVINKMFGISACL